MKRLLAALSLFALVGCQDILPGSSSSNSTPAQPTMDPPTLITPAEGSTASTQPTFSWSFTGAPSGDWCYALVASDDPGDFLPDFFVVLESAGYDMSNPPAANDWRGRIAGPSVAILTPGNWGWSVLVIPCAYDDDVCLGKAENLGSPNGAPLAASAPGSFVVQ